MNDGGPTYLETDTSALVAEPWNMLSAAFFLLVFFFWAQRLRDRWRRHPFLSVCLLLLLVGGLGGTIYHGFRAHSLFLYMDWLPILVLCFAAGAYFLLRLNGNALTMAIFVGGGVLLQFLVYEFLPRPHDNNISYTLLALFVVLPVLAYMKKTRFVFARFVFWALLAFAVALFFRIADPWALLPVGTHFLWHIFGALACHFILAYIYVVQLRRPVPADRMKAIPRWQKRKYD